MAHRIGDRILETTTVTGTGNATFLGAQPGYKTVDSFCTANGDTIDLVIGWTTNAGVLEYEYTRFTRVSAGVYSRATPYDGAATSFTAGTKEVWSDIGAFFAEHLNTVEITATSAATVDIGALRGKFIALSGTTGPTTSLGTAAHKERIVRHSGSVWTCNTTSLILQGVPNGANRTNAVNAISYLKSDSAGNWREIYYREPTPAAPFDALAANNMIVNGGMEVSQENGTSVVTLTASGSLQTKYILDGVMAHYRGTFVATAQQRDVETFAGTNTMFGAVKMLDVRCTTLQSSLGANDELSIVLPVEGYRAAKLHFGLTDASPVTLGFWFNSVLGGTFSGSVRNSAKNRSYPFSFTVSANTYNWIAVTVPGDTTGTWLIDNSVGMYVTICLAGGSSRVGTANAWAASDLSGVTGMTNGVASATTEIFYISTVVALPGSEASSSTHAGFLIRPFDQELALCMRQLYVWNTNGATGHAFALGLSYNTTISVNVLQMPVPMRAAPTISVSAVGHFNIDPGVAAPQAVTSLGNTNTDAPYSVVQQNFNVASGLVAGGANQLVSASTSARLYAKAQL